MSSLQGSGAPGARTAPGKLLRLSYIFAWRRRRNEPQIGDQGLACTSKSPCGHANRCGRVLSASRARAPEVQGVRL